ncbi:MAG: DUF432 domain-containing protein [Methanoregulaceae archaeon]|nr:DUF432 domain-containing protein [Methanoregulaceae archaeon]
MMNAGSVFGVYPFPFRYESGDILVAVEESDPFYTYTRECKGVRVEKVITSPPGTIHINPVEPLTLPKQVTRFLEIRFPPVMVDPLAEKTLYLTFPLDIGVFIEIKGYTEKLDIFSLREQQYSLYGPSDRGVITRYHESGIWGYIPETDPVREGVMQLAIKNAGRSWIEVSRAVFESTNMALFFDDKVGMTGHMELFSSLVAETDIIDRPFREGMKRSIGLSSGRRAPFVEQKGFLMEHGVADES